VGKFHLPTILNIYVAWADETCPPYLAAEILLDRNERRQNKARMGEDAEFTLSK
jgi:hypothetical protein